jgi:hypothetical protein
VTATGKTYDNEPPWCRLDEHHSTVGRHFSAEYRVGDRRRGGEAAAWLKRTGNGPTHLVVFAGHMTSTSADLSLEEAARHRDHLTYLLELAGHEAPKG